MVLQMDLVYTKTLNGQITRAGRGVTDDMNVDSYHRQLLG